MKKTLLFLTLASVGASATATTFNGDSDHSFTVEPYVQYTHEEYKELEDNGDKFMSFKSEIIGAGVDFQNIFAVEDLTFNTAVEYNYQFDKYTGGYNLVEDSTYGSVKKKGRTHVFKAEPYLSYYLDGVRLDAGAEILHKDLKLEDSKQKRANFRVSPFVAATFNVTEDLDLGLRAQMLAVDKYKYTYSYDRDSETLERKNGYKLSAFAHYKFGNQKLKFDLSYAESKKGPNIQRTEERSDGTYIITSHEPKDKSVTATVGLTF